MRYTQSDDLAIGAFPELTPDMKGTCIDCNQPDTF